MKSPSMPPTTATALPLLAARAPQSRSHSPATRDFDIVNPVTGHRAIRLNSAGGANNAPAEFEFSLPARSAGAPRHVHMRITETFTIVAGQLLVEIGERGHCLTLGAGEMVTIAPGTPHGFRNATDAAVVFRCTVTPGADFENFICALYGLAFAGRTDAAGMPKDFWQLVLILNWGDVHVPGVSLALQRWLIGGLASLARRSGAKRALAPYLFPSNAR